MIKMLCINIVHDDMMIVLATSCHNWPKFTTFLGLASVILAFFDNILECPGYVFKNNVEWNQEVRPPT